MRNWIKRLWTKVKETFASPPVIHPLPEKSPVLPKPVEQGPGRIKDTVNDGNTRNPDWTYLWDNCELDKNRIAEVTAICIKIRKHKVEYQVIEDATGVPWFLIAGIHNLEASLDFDAYLHNGQKLGKVTTWVPKGIFFPKGAFIEAAIHALKYDGLDNVGYKSLITCLVMAEKFNGRGNRSRGIYSPYVWAGTQFYKKGKFVQDKIWDANAVSEQIGVAAIFKGLELLGEDLSL